ncbi:MAG: hypothetical protein FAZ92_02290 [Accumulibacter sp.]|nr:MAG: hypothetical protein FAZ92_02290 [Accumulibacter sp.]
MATQASMPRLRKPATWSAISATSGEITTLSAPIRVKRDSAGIW